MANKIHEVLCLGDTVGYAADPARCVTMLRTMRASIVMGNHEYEVIKIRHYGTDHLGKHWHSCGYGAGLVHSANQLTQDQIDWLKSAPSWGEGDRYLAAHSNLEEPMAFHYIESVEDAKLSLEMLRSRNMPVCFLGHTHIQEMFCHQPQQIEWQDETTFRVAEENPCVVMVGSVGKSRMKGDLRAAWAIYDSSEGVVELRKTEYDRATAAKAIINAGLPAQSAMHLLNDEV